MADEIDEIITPEKEWKIGGRTFTQTPLGLDRTIQIISILGEGLFELFQRGGFEGAGEGQSFNVIKIFSALAATAKDNPALFGNLFGIILDVTLDEDKAFIVKHMKPSTTIGVLNTFMQQNDVAEIRDHFLEMQKTWQTKIGKGKPTSKTS